MTILVIFNHLLTQYNITTYIYRLNHSHFYCIAYCHLTSHWRYATILIQFFYFFKNGCENMHDFILCPHGLHKKQIQCNLHTYALFCFGCICGRSSIENMEKMNTQNTSIRVMQFLFEQDEDWRKPNHFLEKTSIVKRPVLVSFQPDVCTVSHFQSVKNGFFYEMVKKLNPVYSSTAFGIIYG